MVWTQIDVRLPLRPQKHLFYVHFFISVANSPWSSFVVSFLLLSWPVAVCCEQRLALSSRLPCPWPRLFLAPACCFFTLWLFHCCFSTMSMLKMAQRDVCLYQLDHLGCLKLMNVDITGAWLHRLERFLENITAASLAWLFGRACVCMRVSKCHSPSLACIPLAWGQMGLRSEGCGTPATCHKPVQTQPSTSG